MVLVTAVGRQEGRESQDFFPLTVDVEERMYAAGKIPGGFIKRESRPTDKAVLTARQIDRPIRPLFPKGYMNETQIVGTVLSVDHENAHDILAMIGASAALTISGIPFLGRSARFVWPSSTASMSSIPRWKRSKTPPSIWWSAAPKTPSSWSKQAPKRSRKRRSSRRCASPRGDQEAHRPATRAAGHGR